MERVLHFWCAILLEKGALYIFSSKEIVFFKLNFIMMDWLKKDYVKDKKSVSMRELYKSNSALKP